MTVKKEGRTFEVYTEDELKDIRQRFCDFDNLIHESAVEKLFLDSYHEVDFGMLRQNMEKLLVALSHVVQLQQGLTGLDEVYQTLSVLNINCKDQLKPLYRELKNRWWKEVKQNVNG
jgi:hypothetical protein